LPIQSQLLANEPNADKRHDGDHDALQERQENCQAKQSVTACVIAEGFRACDKGDNRVIEAEQTDLAQELHRRPRDKVSPEGSRSQKPRDEKGEDAAKIRGEERDGIDQGAALQLRALICRRDDWEGGGRDRFHSIHGNSFIFRRCPGDDCR
jgi:hypothetical protein